MGDMGLVSATMLPDHTEVVVASVRHKFPELYAQVLDLLHKNIGGLTDRDIADAINEGVGTMGIVLDAMVKTGELISVVTKKYTPDVGDLLMFTPGIRYRLFQQDLLYLYPQ